MSPSDTSLIEGIGALHGLIYPPSCFEFLYYLNAFEQNNMLLYGDPFAICYDFTTSVTEYKNKISIAVFPNPTNDHLNIQLTQINENTTLTIYDMLGKAIKTLPLTDKETTINISGMSRGVYILEVATKKSISREKFVKE
jgi:hypothetical protein